MIIVLAFMIVFSEWWADLVFLFETYTRYNGSKKYAKHKHSNTYSSHQSYKYCNRLTMYYDIVIVTLWFSHSFSTKCIGYNTMCIGAHRIWLLNCTSTVPIVTNTGRRETVNSD